MRYTEFNQKKEFSEGSGVISVVDPDIGIKLNKFGIYDEYLTVEGDKELNPLVELVSPNFNSQDNEDSVAQSLFGSIEDINYDKRLGYYSSLYVGHVKEGQFREDASSGGFGTWIFKELLENDLIDGVLHVKDVKGSDDTRLFKYEISTTIEEIKDGAKTKYYPVEMSEVLKFVRENEGRYAVVGIPSFIMAVRLLCKYDDKFKDRIKFTVGIVCGHQKSSKFTESMAQQLNISPENLTAVNYRKVPSGAAANRYSVEFKGNINGKEETISKPFAEFIEENWGEGFFKVRASDFTDDVFNETSDITLGDAWLPDYVSDSLGNNIIIVRNPTLQKLMDNSIDKGLIKVEEVDADTIFESQSSHYKHTHDELAYRLYKLKKENKWIPKKRVEPSGEIDIARKGIQDLREEISISSHLNYYESMEKNNYNIYQKRMKKLVKRYLLQYKINRVRQLGIKESTSKVIKHLLNRHV